MQDGLWQTWTKTETWLRSDWGEWVALSEIVGFRIVPGPMQGNVVTYCVVAERRTHSDFKLSQHESRDAAVAALDKRVAQMLKQRE